MKISVKVPAGKRLIVSETAQEVNAVVDTQESNSSDSSPIQITVKIPAGKQFVVEHNTVNNKKNEKSTNNSELPNSSKTLNNGFGSRQAETVEQKTPSVVMQIFVKNLSGKLNTYSVRPTDTVESLKEQVQKKEGIPSRLQRLIFSGQSLEDDRILQDYKMESANTVFLVLRLLSCQNCPGCKH